MDGLTIFDYVFAAVGLIGLLIIGYHHFFIKPKSNARQRLMEKLYQDEMKRIAKSIKGE